MQTKKFPRPSRNTSKTPDKQGRVLKSNEGPLIRLATLKLYSKIKSKELISDHLKKGMSLLYNRAEAKIFCGKKKRNFATPRNSEMPNFAVVSR